MLYNILNFQVKKFFYSFFTATSIIMFIIIFNIYTGDINIKNSCLKESQFCNNISSIVPVNSANNKSSLLKNYFMNNKSFYNNSKNLQFGNSIKNNNLKNNNHLDLTDNNSHADLADNNNHVGLTDNTYKPYYTLFAKRCYVKPKEQTKLTEQKLNFTTEDGNIFTSNQNSGLEDNRITNNTVINNQRTQDSGFFEEVDSSNKEVHSSNTSLNESIQSDNNSFYTDQTSAFQTPIVKTPDIVKSPYFSFVSLNSNSSDEQNQFVQNRTIDTSNTEDMYTNIEKIYKDNGTPNTKAFDKLLKVIDNKRKQYGRIFDMSLSQINLKQVGELNGEIAKNIDESNDDLGNNVKQYKPSDFNDSFDKKEIPSKRKFLHAASFPLKPVEHYSKASPLSKKELNHCEKKVNDRIQILTGLLNNKDDKNKNTLSSFKKDRRILDLVKDINEKSNILAQFIDSKSETNNDNNMQLLKQEIENKNIELEKIKKEKFQNVHHNRSRNTALSSELRKCFAEKKVIENLKNL